MKNTLRSIRIEDTRGHIVHVFEDCTRDEVLVQVRAALRAGHAVRWEDGTREWWVLEERVDTSKTGSDRYQWSADGNRVRADLVKYVQDRSGTITKTVIPGRHFVEACQ